MLSKRDKLLVQPWEDRRFRNHRSKVSQALPAIDDTSPIQRPHVIAKLKKSQREEDRKAKIQNDNFSLLQRLSAIMKINRLDNHWKKPQPNFHHKVGLYFPVEHANRSTQTKAEESSMSCKNIKCFACEVKKTQNKE